MGRLGRLTRAGEREEERNEIPVVVHTAGAVLATGADGPGALSAGLAVSAALPAGGGRRRRRPRPGLGDRHIARPHAPRALAREGAATAGCKKKWPRHGLSAGCGHVFLGVSTRTRSEERRVGKE